MSNRSSQKPRKGRSQAQKAALNTGRERKLQQKRRKPKSRTQSELHQQVKKLQGDVAYHKKEVELLKKRFWNERKQHLRKAKAFAELKTDHRQLGKDVGDLRKALDRMERESKLQKRELEGQVAYLQEKVKSLKACQSDLQHDRTVLRKRNERLLAAKRSLKHRMRELARTQPRKFRTTSKGVYTRQIRCMARYLAGTGMAEAKVGTALNDISALLGVKLDRVMSRRTVQRCVLEGGVAADIQLTLEMVRAAKICYSSDSTSHRRIEYESRYIAMQVVDYENPDAEPSWKMRSMGVDTSVDHSSETQMAGLRARLQELADVFNNSPLAKRLNLHFDPDDFVYKLIGTSGDHAADQKKCHRCFEIWKLEVLYQRLGEEAIFAKDNHAVVASLLALKVQQIELVGGQAAWDALTEAEKVAAHASIVRELGKQVFENLPDKDRRRLTLFVRTGCCMHKDLNCFKGGDRAMQDIWEPKDKTKPSLTPPVLLANKQNAEVIAGVRDGDGLTKDQQRALESSKRGASKATELGGMIFRNKDSKKGQQDVYKYWMLNHCGHDVPYPDVSNTRYGTHGEAAGVIITHLEAFREFMKHVHLAKDPRRGQVDTNIEINFAAALSDAPTLTEMCVLALYHVAISRPFMRYVRLHHNMLDLRSFFERKNELLASIIADPSPWTQPGGELASIYLDADKQETFAVDVLKAVHLLSSQLPHLNQAVVAFATGARNTFIERFSDEFKDGTALDVLTPDERSQLFFPSTNDVNEGALGAWRLAQRHRVAETLHKFNSSRTATLNGTEGFITHMLTEEEDHQYLRQSARQRDEAKLASKRKRAQIEADNAKAAKNRAKEIEKEEKRLQKEATLKETSANLVLDTHEIERLGKDALNLQLDYHRNAEIGMDIPEKERVPLKSHMKQNPIRVQFLKLAVCRYKNRQMQLDNDLERVGIQPAQASSNYDRDHEYDYEDDHH